MFDAVFDWCVAILVWLANMTGMTYKDINVWIFVIIWPALFIVLAAIIVIQQVRIRQLGRG